MNVPAQELKLRIQVVQLALMLFNRKEHYYWGAPDTGKIRMWPDAFSSDPKQLHVLAASIDGVHFCAGRSQREDVQQRAHFTGSAPVDVWMSVSQPMSYPRFYLDGDTVNPSPSGQVWGESCAGKMHFDCGSFVRYCFRTILGPALVTPGIQMHDLAQSVWSSDSGKKLSEVDVLPADIVYAHGTHVGLTTGKPEYLKAENGAVGIPADETVHAYFAKMGVVKTSLASPRAGEPSWSEIRRWQKWS